MNNTAKMNVGIIGCGSFGRLHSESIRKLGLFKLYAYADPVLPAAEACCEKYGAAYATADQHRILQDPNVDVVFVCTTHDAHHPIAMEAIANKKHIFMEKPLAMTVEQCEEIVRGVEATGITCAVGHKMSHSPNVQRARHEMPRPITMVAQMMCDRWPDDIWAQDPVKGGGNVLSQGCHVFDLVSFLAGAEPESLYAEGADATHPGSGMIDNIVSTVRFKNGVMASVILGDCGYNGFTSKTMLQMYGGDDCINLSQRLYRYARYQGGALTEAFDLPEDHTDMDIDPEGFFAEVRDFYNAIKTGHAPLVGARQGANAVKMVYGMFQAARTGKVQHW